jgi:hypothetical protein
MKSSELVRQYDIGENSPPHTVWLGDTVWWFAQNETSGVPAPATVLAFCEDNMVNLSYLSVVGTGKQVVITGVCLVGDERLGNNNYRKNGSWLPRTAFGVLPIKD